MANISILKATSNLIEPQKPSVWNSRVAGPPELIESTFMDLPPNGWFIRFFRGNPHLEMDDLGGPPFQETSIYGNRCRSKSYATDAMLKTLAMALPKTLKELCLVTLG